jgi:hypothetical protein
MGELISPAFLLEEESEHAGCWQPTYQGGGLVVRARLAHALQQPSDAERVVEGDGLGGTAIGIVPHDPRTCGAL